MRIEADRALTVAALTGTENRRNDPGAGVDAADDVVFGVGDVELAGCVGETLRPGKRRSDGRAAVTRVPLRSAPRQMVNRRGFRGDAVDRIALAQRKEQLSLSKRHRARAVERRAFQRRAVRRWLPVAGAAVGLDRAARQIDLTNTVIADIADQKSPGAIDGNAVRLAQLRAGRRSPIA